MKVSFDFDHQTTTYVQGEEFLLGQAIYNLLENALDFSPENSAITIDLAQDEVGVQITIKDHGPGIPGYALNKIFNKFYSLPRPNTQQKSTGLGLNFVREVIELHKGELSLQNSDKGGVQARMTLPTNH